MTDLFKNVFSAGSAAVISSSFVHPIDVVKTRLQVSTSKNSMLHVFKDIIKNENITGLWKGVNAAWLREATYTSSRLGLYDPIKQLYGCTNADNTTFVKKFLAGSTSGAIGSCFGNPFDVLKTNMMTSKNGRQITNLANQLYKSQGIYGFYRGIDSNIARAMVLNGTKMACYEEIKDNIVAIGYTDNKSPVTQFFAAMGAGFFMTITVAPFDMIRTRLMNQPVEEKIYKNAIDCSMKLIKQNGILSLWKGFFPIWGRFAPNTTLQLIFYEQIKNQFAG